MPKILVFGETGHGKTSMLNCLTNTRPGLTNRDMYYVGHDSAGTTFQTQPYPLFKTRNGVKLEFFDTVGLGEASRGAMGTFEALMALVTFVRDHVSGFNLMIMVAAAPRFTAQMEKNWVLFNDIFFNRKLKSILVFTKMDTVTDDWDEWLETNFPHLHKYGFERDDILTTTWLQGPYPPYIDQQRMTRLVEKSRDKLLATLQAKSTGPLVPMFVPEQPETSSSTLGMIVSIVRYVWGWVNSSSQLTAIHKEKVLNGLKNYGLSEEEALELYLEGPSSSHCVIQ